jgi:hypothetical protein
MLEMLLSLTKEGNRSSEIDLCPQHKVGKWENKAPKEWQAPQTLLTWMALK